MSLPSIESLDLESKRVFVRASLDVPVKDGIVENAERLDAAMLTLQKLKESSASKVIIAGHMGRPDGGYDPKLSTLQLIDWFKNHLGEDVYYLPYKSESEITHYAHLIENSNQKFYLLDNLRFWLGEEENIHEFAQRLKSFFDVYINDAFDVAHRAHTSVTGLPGLAEQSAFGESFVREYEHLKKVLDDPERPMVLLLSGVKEDKLNYLDRFLGLADKVLISGRLPEYLGEDYKNPKAVIAHLIQDKEDITLHSMETFESEIAKAATIVVSGPMGKFEEEGHRQGTERVFGAIAKSNAYKLAGGGDTAAAIDLLGLRDKFDWVSIAGGAMLDFLSDGSLPGIDAIVK